MTALFSGAALMNAAMAVASAVSTIVAGERLGARWGAVPNTASIVGTGIGALALTVLMNRHGRRVGLTCGYVASACGGALSAAAVAAGDVIALSVGMLLLGLGNAGAQLSRYAAAGLYPPGRRGFAISTVVWAGALGAVGGPLLLGPSNYAATHFGLPSLTGPYVLAALTTLGAAAVIATTRPKPTVARSGGEMGPAGAAEPDTTRTEEAGTAGAADGTPAGASGDGAGACTSEAAAGDEAAPVDASPSAESAPANVTVVAGGAGTGGAAGATSGRVRLREVVRPSGARTALVVMATAQVVMVAVMTAAPLDMHMHGQGLDAVGMTLSAHTLGMFAFSPVTGRLLDRVGARPVMVGGLLTLVVATVLAATTPEGDAPVRTGALFLLGYGWNLCFVGGSGRLARDLPASARASVEGAVDAAVWSVAAAASLGSTLVLSAGGYAALAWAACALVALPAVLLLTAEAS
jgi:MFS family permease